MNEFGYEPKVLIIPGNNIKMSKNAPPVPTVVKFTFGETDEPLHIIFQYDGEMKNRSDVMEWIRQYSHSFGTGYGFTKEQLVFDGEFHFKNRTLHGFNLLLKNAEFFDSLSDDDIVLSMEMSYERFFWEI